MADVRRTILGVAGGLILAVAISLASLAAVSVRSGAAAVREPATAPRSLIVATDKGLLEGRTSGAVDQFLGIPYAAAPTGALRWQPPRPAAPWRGVRAALSYGGRCAQLASGNGPRIDNEDCLYLNVFAPAVIPAGRALPVLFMIHGGGLSTGAGDEHDGSLLAQSGHIIVVSVNYRLGPFGFLAVPGLSPAQHGNFGLLDTEAALGWVHRNIGAFGGDPGRVTIAGESAGGWSVCALLASPAARGLFRQAIIESGGCVSQGLAAARGAGLAFAKSAGCADAATAAACLRGKPEAELLSASKGYVPMFTVGGPELPSAPSPAIAPRMPVLIGANHDEGRTFAQDLASLTRQGYARFVTARFPGSAARVLRLYPWSAYPRPYTAAYAAGAILTDSGAVGGIGGCATQNLAARLAANGSPVYFYEFDDGHAPGLNDRLPGYQWGAGHAMELPYLWPGFNNGFSLAGQFTPAQQLLSRQMVAYWAAFVTQGAPRVPGQPAWPRYATGMLLSLRPGGQTRAVPAAAYRAEHRCSFWDSQPSPPRPPHR